MYFFLNELQLLRLDKLLRNSCIALLCAQTKIPEFLTERSRILLQKASELDL
jgi:hypothetical protein